jgi:DNA-binding response OmpR family regulator
MSPLDESAKQHLFNADLSDKRVLIVDRHPPARDALRMMLGNLGITKVHGAGSGQEVLRQTAGNAFDIILSDYMLEDGRDGQQLLEELRLQRLVPLSTIFIVVTGERNYRNVVGVAELTPDDYLIKPFTTEQLLTRLGRALYRKDRLARILRNLDAGAYQLALSACDELIGHANEFLLEATRLKGAILDTLGRYEDAETLYREILVARPLPWARMGLAEVLMAKGKLGEAEELARSVVNEHKHFLAAHDFLAKILAAAGRLDDAQLVATEAAQISPHNTLRQRSVGTIALRNGDLDAAERAYQNVLTRARRSAVSTVDDYVNLSRVLLEKGAPARAKNVALELRRERRGDAASEVAALTIDSLAAKAEGDDKAAARCLQLALDARAGLQGKDVSLPENLLVDLAHAAMATGQAEIADDLMRRVVVENPDDDALHRLVESVYAKNGDQAAGQALLDTVRREIVSIKHEGARTAQQGDLEGSVKLLAAAAERMPNLPFLLNAANAIFTLLDRKGWQAELAETGVKYLLKAQQKDRRDSKFLVAYDFFQGVAQKYGISVAALRQQVADGLKNGTLR